MPLDGSMFHLNIMFLQNVGNYLLCTFALIRVVFPMDLCSDFSSRSLASNFHSRVTPRGGANAGKFYEDHGAADFEQCVKSCCKNVLCNVAFYFNDACLLISCNASFPEGCEPEEQQEARFRNTFWLTLRPIGPVLEKDDKRYASSTASSSIPLPSHPSPRVNCESDSDCNTESEVCRSVSSEFPMGQRCECAPGFLRSLDTQLCSKATGIRGRPCTVGLNTVCLPTEVCLPRNDRSRSGSCECLDGYSRRVPGISCLPVDSSSLKSAVHSTDREDSTTVLITTSHGPSTSSKSSTTLTTLAVNQAPVAKILPPSQEVQQPNNLLIDGSGSYDDVKIVSYSWEVVSKPIDSHLEIDSSDVIKPVLALKNLSPGFYRFKLTVKDKEGLKSSAFSNATVIKEIDHPPVADAGPDIVVNLPVAMVMLYGNASRDDKEIIAYEWWKKSSDSPAVDMEGVRTPFLKLSNFQAGMYTFSLQVTDSSGQTNSKDVHVLVRPEQHQPPVAVAGPNQTLSLPVGIVILNGSESSDDQKIESYLWTLVSGQSSVVINNPQSAVTSVSKLTIGQYLFQLTVRDHAGLESSAITTVTVKEVTNHAPVAHAGGNLVVTLPVDVVTMNGSQSSDDERVVSYSWTRDKSSPAAGDVLFNSDHEPILQLINVVSGRYLFTLEVKDAEGLTDQDTISLIVRPDPLELNLVELHLVADAALFAEKDKAVLKEKLSMLLGKIPSSGTTRVVIRKLGADIMSGLTLVTFYVETLLDGKSTPWSGPEVVDGLKKTIPSSLEILDFQIAQFDTVVCQNNCSGHGTCNPVTRRCHCEGFWMENFFKAHFGEHESNCDWSILYVVLVIVVAFISTVAMLCIVLCVCRRCAYCKPKPKRHRYTLLEERADDDDDDSKDSENLRLLRKGRMQNSSLMQSESDFSSEETIFINNKRPVNGSAGKFPNGSARRSKATA